MRSSWWRTSARDGGGEALTEGCDATLDGRDHGRPGRHRPGASAVFLPMAFFGGSTGVIYRQFSITIVSAMTLSVMVALIFTPSLCATLLKPRVAEAHERERGFFGWFNRGFNRMNRGYERGVESCHGTHPALPSWCMGSSWWRWACCSCACRNRSSRTRIRAFCSSRWRRRRAQRVSSRSGPSMRRATISSRMRKIS